MGFHFFSPPSKFFWWFLRLLRAFDDVHVFSPSLGFRVTSTVMVQLSRKQLVQEPLRDNMGFSFSHFLIILFCWLQNSGKTIIVEKKGTKERERDDKTVAIIVPLNRTHLTRWKPRVEAKQGLVLRSNGVISPIGTQPYHPRFLMQFFGPFHIVGKREIFSVLLLLQMR